MEFYNLKIEFQSSVDALLFRLINSPLLVDKQPYLYDPGIDSSISVGLIYVTFTNFFYDIYLTIVRIMAFYDIRIPYIPFYGPI